MSDTYATKEAKRLAATGRKAEIIEKMKQGYKLSTPRTGGKYFLERGTDSIQVHAALATGIIDSGQLKLCGDGYIFETHPGIRPLGAWV